MKTKVNSYELSDNSLTVNTDFTCEWCNKCNSYYHDYVEHNHHEFFYCVNCDTAYETRLYAKVNNKYYEIELCFTSVGNNKYGDEVLFFEAKSQQLCDNCDSLTYYLTNDNTVFCSLCETEYKLESLEVELR
jgi:hypothetical protein